jgi:RNA polymerase sigma-70 factor (ECF subfamily)
LKTTAQGRSTRPLPQDFETTFRTHYDLIYKAAYRITGRAEDAEDVLQTLFLRLLRRECPPDISENPKAYLHRAAVNIALDLIAVRGRNVSTDDLVVPLQDPAPSAERIHSGNEIQEWLRRALADLGPRAAEIFVLRHIEGYKNAEIAKIIGTSRGTIAVTLFRARFRLKKSIRTYLGENS